MPTGATMTAGGTAQKTNGRNNAPVVAQVPFIRASMEHREPTGVDISRVITGADQDLGVFDVPAYGYLRSLLLVITATGGVGGAANVAAAEDAPWSALKNVALTEPNGAVIAQFNSGYDLYLANKWGGYRGQHGADPKSSPTFSGVASGAGASGNFSFVLRVPTELNLRDGLGSLPNQNAAATFKLKATLAASATIYATAPATTLPTVRLRVFTESWDQPETSSGGATNQITPPAMNTTQFWTSQVYNVAAAGQQTFRLTRVGNYIRNLIFVFRSGVGATPRSAGDPLFPDPVTLLLDARPIDIIERNNFRHQMYERTGFGGVVGGGTTANETPQGLDNGVFVYDFAHEFDGGLGMENRDLWLPTLGSTRFEIQGNFGGTGTLTVLTNDVAVAGPVFM